MPVSAEVVEQLAREIDGLRRRLDALDLIENAGGGGGGEANTASNVGTAGVGVFKQKTGVDLEFKKVSAGSGKVSVTDDVANSEVDIDVVEGSLSLNNIGGTLQENKGGTAQTGYARGDLLYATLINQLGKLAIGTAGYVLKSNGTIPQWAELFYQTVRKAGTPFTQRPSLNFEDGTGISITVADDVGNNRTNVTVAATGGGGGAALDPMVWM